MIAIPAIDLREGACVQLVGGSYASERVRRADPVAVAREFSALGFSRLHVIDLDAATGRGTNAHVIERILDVPGLTCQVGGGIRSTAQARALVDRGATVVVGTRALGDDGWLAELLDRCARRVILALDVKQGQIAVEGWTKTLDSTAESVAGSLDQRLAGVLVTSVDLEGRMEGCDQGLYRRIASRTDVPIIASGGIGSMQDLSALGEIGVAAAVIGMALYTGRLDPAEVAARHGGRRGRLTNAGAE